MIYLGFCLCIEHVVVSYDVVSVCLYFSLTLQDVLETLQEIFLGTIQRLIATLRLQGM